MKSIRHVGGNKHQQANEMPIEDPQPQKQPKKNTTSLIKFCGGFLVTRDMVDESDRANFIRVTLIELIIYIVFLTTASTVTFATTSTDRFYYNNAISHLFLEAPFPDGEINFENSYSAEHFWRFLETVLPNGLYWETWFGDPDLLVGDKDEGVLYENILLGLPRLRQIRVKTEPCPIPESFRRIVRICFPPYDREKEVVGVYEEYENLTDRMPWHTQYTEAQLKGENFWGTLASYSGAGSFTLLSKTRLETMEKIHALKTGLWINRATRVVFLDFTLYNANVNLFSIVKLVWEFPATGGVITSESIRTVKLIRYVSTFDHFIYGLEIMFTVFVVCYTIQELIELYFTNIFSYLSNAWSYVDVSILCLSYTCIGFSIYRSHIVHEKLDQLLSKSDEYADFEYLGIWETQFINVSAIGMFFMWVKVIKFLSFNRTMTQLSTTLSRCTKDVVGFSVLFFLTFFAFVQLGYVLFGSQVMDFSTFGESTFTLLRLILGDFNFREIENANKFLGPIFFLSYVFFVFFVLLNVFLAIINDTYSEVKSEVKSQRNQYETIDYLKNVFNNMFGSFGIRSKKINAENEAKIASSEKHITQDELKRHLQEAQFSDVEIEMFLARYELDHDRVLDEDEMYQVLGELEGRALIHTGSGENAGPIKLKSDLERDLELAQEEISNMQQRISAVEGSIKGVLSKLDLLIQKLDDI